MYKYNSINYNKRMYPALRNLFYRNKQKYAQNCVVIKRQFSYANLPPGEPNNLLYYLLLFPLIMHLYHKR
jgi:hypothetical protein